jgi:hypothetical protein
VRAALAVVTLAVGMQVALAAPAAANTPLRGWEETGAMSLGNALLVFVGGPLAIAVVITLLVMAPSAVSHSRDQGSLSLRDAQWFGGELGAGSAERPELEAAAVAAGTDDLDEVAAGGGASARW